MLRWLLRRRIDATERQLGAPLDYVREMLNASTALPLRFFAGTALLARRRRAPRDVWHVAGLVTTRHEDCGACVQIGVNLALKDGVPADVLRAVLDRAPERLPEPLAEAYRFAAAVCAADGSEERWRDALRRRHGEEALIELSLAVATARVFPTVKRGMGHAVSCALVPVKVG
jgi:alkylhydroperoxidase family enzyme